MIMQIIPALLCETFSDFQQKLARVEPIFNLVQIDIMDGVFVPNKSFFDIEKINELKTKTKFEVHLMVEHPLQEIEKWLEIKNLERIIFHIESKDNPDEVIAQIRGACKQVGMATNPETPFAIIKPYLNKIDEILFMTVNPGAQGREFLPEIKNKIIECAATANHPTIAVDGGINIKNIGQVKSWGVEIAYTGSSITLAEDTKKAYNTLKQAAGQNVFDALISIFKRP